ncbi:hypothetical protein ACLOJK_020170 [Asimina triloba]
MYEPNIKTRGFCRDVASSARSEVERRFLERRRLRNLMLCSAERLTAREIRRNNEGLETNACGGNAGGFWEAEEEDLMRPSLGRTAKDPRRIVFLFIGMAGKEKRERRGDWEGDACSPRLRCVALPSPCRTRLMDDEKISAVHLSMGYFDNWATTDTWITSKSCKGNFAAFQRERVACFGGV